MKIMVIRHAEKPADPPPPHGIDEDGSHDPDSLTALGWQRAGALAPFFNPSDGALLHPRLAVPKFLFASGLGRTKSRRPIQTITPLSRKFEPALALHTQFSKGEEEALVRAVLALAGPVLVCWQHELIPAIANLILGNTEQVPQEWPSDRFDLVWVLESDNSGRWSFAQVPELLLAGDLAEPIG